VVPVAVPLDTTNVLAVTGWRFLSFSRSNQGATREIEKRFSGARSKVAGTRDGDA
jgi:hypothetical protein